MKVCNLDMIIFYTYTEKLKYFMQLSGAKVFYLTMYLKKCSKQVVIFHAMYVIFCSSALFIVLPSYGGLFVHHFIYVQYKS